MKDVWFRGGEILAVLQDRLASLVLWLVRRRRVETAIPRRHNSPWSIFNLHNYLLPKNHDPQLARFLIRRKGFLTFKRERRVDATSEWHRRGLRGNSVRLCVFACSRCHD